jgi:hypothetical protein
MTGIQVGFMMFGIMMAMLVIRVPSGIAMFSVGAGGYVYLSGGDTQALMGTLKNLAYSRLSNYDLVVIPLFLLSDLVRIVILMFFPIVSLYLVHTFHQ